MSKRFVIYRAVYQYSGFLGDETTEIELGEVYKKDKPNWKELKKSMKKKTIQVSIVSDRKYNPVKTVHKKHVIGYAATLEDLKNKYAEYLI